MKDEIKKDQETDNDQDDFFSRVQDAKDQASQNLKNKIQKKKILADFKRSNSYGDQQEKPMLKKKFIPIPQSPADKQLNNSMHSSFDKEKQYQKKQSKSAANRLTNEERLNMENPEYTPQDYKDRGNKLNASKEKSLKVFKKTINSLPPKGRESVRRVLGD